MDLERQFDAHRQHASRIGGRFGNDELLLAFEVRLWDAQTATVDEAGRREVHPGARLVFAGLEMRVDEEAAIGLDLRAAPPFAVKGVDADVGPTRNRPIER